MLNFSSYLCAEVSLPQTLAASRAGEAGGAYTMRRAETPTFKGLPLPQNQPGPLPFPHNVGKWDANFPNPQNSNIAQFNSFSTLVALKKKKIKTNKKSKINRILGKKKDNYLYDRGPGLVLT